jgi:predicted transcriptional regulator
MSSKDKKFTKINNDVLKVLLTLNSNEIKVYLWFAQHASNDFRQAWGSTIRIAKECYIVRRTVQRSIAKLVDEGLLDKYVYPMKNSLYKRVRYILVEGNEDIQLIRNRQLQNKLNILQKKEQERLKLEKEKLKLVEEKERIAYVPSDYGPEYDKRFLEAKKMIRELAQRNITNGN